MEFKRFAIYCVPDQIELANLGASFLGWDITNGREVKQIYLPGFDINKLTEHPKKYGFHATMKAPFRLKVSKTCTELVSALNEFSIKYSPVVLEGLEVKRLGNFLALCPVGSEEFLNRFVADVVEHFDRFRAPLLVEELDRRREIKLTTNQETLMKKWGYPFVMDEFRFHFTLTGALSKTDISKAYSAVVPIFKDTLEKPFSINSLCLVGEAEDCRFHLIRRFALLG